MINGSSRPNGKRHSKPRLLSALELVDKFRISYQTLNHYTNLGLLNNSTRQGLRRFYREDDVKWRLRKIKALQNKGYTLRLIAQFLR
ncbi:MAG: MerR family transcriptional regulator [Candidatus Omnitrophica bacterium]|nr:MerR family transcriptional regulator [Candidatus Omnitrophota bacterium]